MDPYSDIHFDDATDVASIQHRLHPLDVGWDLRSESVAVDLGDDTYLRVSYEIDGDRRVVSGPREDVVTRLREAGYTIANR